MAVDDDLARFNAFIAGEVEQEKQGRRIKKAEQAKEKAAAEVRRLDGDSGATAEQKAEAKQAYLDATEAWRREVAGEGVDDPTPADADTAEPPTSEAEASDAEASHDAVSDADATAGESAADEQPAEAEADEPPAEDAPAAEVPSGEPAPSDDAPTEGVASD